MSEKTKPSLPSVESRRFTHWLLAWNGQQVMVELVTGNKIVGQLAQFDGEMDHVRMNIVEDGHEVGEAIPLHAIVRVRPMLRKLTPDEEARRLKPDRP